MNPLLMLTAAIEAGTGAALLLAPDLLVRLLLGVDVVGAAIPLGRIAGAALLALGVACWRARDDAGRAATGLVAAMSFYNFGAALILGSAGFESPTTGALLGLVVILHAAMAVWCVALLSRGRTDREQTF
jgi:hypothetical protein